MERNILLLLLTDLSLSIQIDLTGQKMSSLFTILVLKKGILHFLVWPRILLYYYLNLVRLTSQVQFFLNGAELSLNSVNSGNLINHCSMNWGQFKNPVSHMCVIVWLNRIWVCTCAGPSPVLCGYLRLLNSNRFSAWVNQSGVRAMT